MRCKAGGEYWLDPRSPSIATTRSPWNGSGSMRDSMLHSTTLTAPDS